MSTQLKIIGLATLGAAALFAAPANAQVQEGTQQIDIYGGELFGDRITDREISGTKPELDDDVTYGVRYTYNITDAFGLETAIGGTPTSVTKLAGGDVDLDLTTIDLDAVWHFNRGNRVVTYVLAGVGYAQANLDDPILGTVNGQAVRIDDDNGFTLNAGVGAKFFVNDRFLVRLEARYRYLDKVVDQVSDSLNTVETTLGVGWQF